MATLSVATQEQNQRTGRTALDAQSLPRLTAANARQERREVLSDAEVAAQWLNAARKAKPSSYERVVSVRKQLEELRAVWTRLQSYSTPEYDAARREYEERRAKLKAGHPFGGAVRFPNIDTPEYRRLRRQTKRLHSRLNEALARYVFRPRLTYFVFSYFWRGGMVSDNESREFQMKLEHPGGRQTISEADAVLALVRLDLTGDITNVRLCDVCHVVWLAARKSDQHCCSTECRTAFHVSQPGYHVRKAAKQREYRKKWKQEDTLAKARVWKE